eukprot:symbB.v1.2.032800.t1/scaffold3984.1/size46886/3
MAGIEVHNLRLIGKLSDGDQNADIQGCRELCHSDILCQYWQYGRDGCQIEDPAYSTVQYPLTLEGGASTTSDYAKTVVAGEYIQHYCPPRSQQHDPTALRAEKPDPLGPYANWRFVPYGILVSLVILMFVCLAFCVLDQKDNASLSDVHHVDAATSPAMPAHNSRPMEVLPTQAPLGVQLASLPQRFFSTRPMPTAPMGVRTPGAPLMLAAYPRGKTWVHLSNCHTLPLGWSLEECPATEITRSCTKWNYVCLDFNQLPWAAFRIASSGRPGPCHIDLPKDIVSMKAKVPEAIFKKAAVSSADAPPMLDMSAAADLINKAKRPILYVGQGASHCPEIVTKLAHKAQIPVTTTCHGMGIFDEHDPLSMHMLGMHGAAYANFAIQNSDCIIAVGSRFDDRTTGIVAKYAPKARAAEKEGTGGIIHVNIDKSTFGKVLQPTVALWADTQHALEAMEPLVSSQTREDWKDWKKEHAFGYVKAPGGKLKTQQVIEAINTFLEKKKEKDVIVATGVGNHQMMSCQFIRWTKPRTFITSGSLGVMGAGLPFAIGAQVANPDALTILIDGDGSFGMTNMDLQTVKRYKLPIKMAVMNDHRQQMVWIWQRLFFEGRYISVTNDNPDFVALSKAPFLCSNFESSMVKMQLLAGIRNQGTSL